METITVQVLRTELEIARESLDRALECLIPARITSPLHNETWTSGKCARRNPTIKFVTENGFTIERVCEWDGSITDSASSCQFIVGRPLDEECRVRVTFADKILQVLARESSPGLLNTSRWWRCAESHLATYLWEMNKVPPGRRLVVTQLRVEDQYLARPSE